MLRPGSLLPPSPRRARDHLAARTLHVSHGKGPLPTSVTRVLGSGCGTGGRGCYAARPVSDRTEAAFTMARLRYGGSPTQLTAAFSRLLITTSSALEPSSPRARGPLSVGPQHPGALAAHPVHIPLPCRSLNPSALRPPPRTGLPSMWPRSPSSVMWTLGDLLPSSCS